MKKMKLMKWEEQVQDRLKWKDIVEKAKTLSQLQRHRRRRRRRGTAPLILNLALNTGEWSASRPGRITSRKSPRYPSNRRISRAQKRSRRFGAEKKSLTSARNRNPNRSNVYRKRGKVGATVLNKAPCQGQPRPLYPPGKSPPYLLNRTHGGLHSRCRRFGEQSLVRVGIRTPDRPACSLVPYQLRSSDSPCLFIQPQINEM